MLLVVNVLVPSVTKNELFVGHVVPKESTTGFSFFYLNCYEQSKHLASELLFCSGFLSEGQLKVDYFGNTLVFLWRPDKQNQQIICCS